MKKKRRIRIHKGRLAILLTFLVVIIIAIYYAIAAIVALFTYNADQQPVQVEKKMEPELTPEMLACDKRMAHRLDSLMHIPQRLDTNLIAVSVFDATTQRHVYGFHDDQSLIPASCMKISTAIAALKTLGMDYRYHEHILAIGEMKRDTLVGNLLLLADDDPLMESFDPLIKKMRSRGIRHVRGNVYITLAREDTLRPHPTAKAWDIPYYKTPLLLRGKRYVERTFRASLRMNGVTVKRDRTVNAKLSKGSFGGGKYHYVATTSHSLRDVITPMLIHSSNIKADAVFYHLDWKQGLMPQRRMNWNCKHFAEIFWREQTQVLDSVNTKLAFHDGSGLSPENRLSASVLVDMLRYAYDDKQLKDYFIDEAFASTAGGDRRGSLLTRMSHPEYRGRLFCKTGTMTTRGASSLSGYLIASDGHWYIFSIINADSPVAESRIFQDRLCKMMMK